MGNNVTTHEGWGMGSYCVFTTDASIAAYHSFEVPNTPNVKFHNILTVSLGKGSITTVINEHRRRSLKPPPWSRPTWCYP